MESRLVAQLRRLQGWRLGLGFSLATVLVALLIVSLMDLALMGRITADYLLTGLVTAGIVAPASLFLLSTLLREIAGQRQRILSRHVESAEARLQDALESTDEGILMVAEDGRVLAANPRFFELWRVPPGLAALGQDEPLLQHVLDQLVDPEGFLAGVRRLYGSTAPARDTLQFKDGRVFERHTRTLNLDGDAGRIWCFRDVSEAARAREALAEREEHYRAIVNQAGEGIDLVDAETLCLLEVNEAACRMLGYRRDELVGQPLTTIQARWDEAAVREVVARVLRDGQTSFENRHRRKDGHGIDVFVSTRALRLRGRTCMVGVWHDIGERKAADLALKESRTLLKAIIDAAPVRVFWKDQDLRYLGCNPAFARDAGLEGPEDLIGKDDFQLAWADLAQRYRADDRAVVAAGVAKLSFEEPQTTPDGRTRWLRTSKVPLRNHDHQTIGLLGVYEDITEVKQIEQAARASDERSRKLATLLRLLADNVPDMIWAKDLDHRFLFANRATCQQLLLAADTDEPLGKDMLFFVQRERQAHADDPQWHTLGDGCLDSDAVTLQRMAPSVFEESGNVGGRPAWFEVHKAPFIDERGEAIGTVGSARDITERKRVEAELERHRHHLEELVEQRSAELLATEARATRILDSTADGLYGVDSEGRISFINPAACRMLGYSAEQARGRCAHALFHHSRPDGSPCAVADCALHQAWRAGRECRFDDETYWHADGHPVPVTLASHPLVEHGEIVGAVVSVVDNTSQRDAQRAREQALVAAENLARARSEFLANMSHEIRTPMNGVLGFARIGQRHHQDPARSREAFEKILAAGNQLLGVVNDILDFSRIDAGKLHIERTSMSIGRVVDDAVELVADRARAKGLDLQVNKAADLPATCLGDPLRLAQVLLNLLSNAIKFTEAGSVTLSAVRQGDQLVLRVADTGIGMTAEQLGFVFNPFQQGDGSTTRRFGGTGLGLAICKRLLELMQGEIRAESVPGRGSVFEVRLPCLPPPAPPPDPQPATAPALPGQPLAGTTILLAEDDEVNRSMLELILVDDGARVVGVGDGLAAVARVAAGGPRAFDIVLMDVQMPQLDGYEATRRILALAPDLPIVGQTASAFDEDRDKCLRAGMVGYIAKPIDAPALLQLLLQVLATRR